MTNKVEVERNTAKLKELLHLHYKLSDDLIHEKRQIQEFNIQINKIEKELCQLKEKSEMKYSNSGWLENQSRAQQQLENRLDVVSYLKCRREPRQNSTFTFFLLFHLL